jgi:hypothetical protein
MAARCQWPVTTSEVAVVGQSQAYGTLSCRASQVLRALEVLKQVCLMREVESLLLWAGLYYTFGGDNVNCKDDDSVGEIFRTMRVRNVLWLNCKGKQLRQAGYGVGTCEC